MMTETGPVNTHNAIEPPATQHAYQRRLWWCLCVLCLAGRACLPGSEWLSEEQIRAAIAPARSYTIETGTIALGETAFHGQCLNASWCRAVEDDGRAPPRAQQLICYLQHPTERFHEPPQKEWQKKLFRRIARETGCTVFGVFFPDQTKSMEIWTQREGYLFRHSGSYAVILEAGRRVCEHLGLDADRPWLAIGSSAGGTLAQRLADYAPERFAAIASMGGSNFIQIRGSRSASLLLNTLGDATSPANDGLRAYLDRCSAPYLRWVTMPEWNRRGFDSAMFRHCINDNGNQLALDWLCAFSDQIDAHGSILSEQNWPYACDPDHPERALRTKQPDWQARLGVARPQMIPSAAVLWDLQQRPALPSLAERDSVVLASCLPRPGARGRGSLILSWGDTPERATQRDGADTTSAEWDVLQVADAGWRALAWTGERAQVFRLADRLRAEAPVAMLLQDPSASELEACLSAARDPLDPLIIVADRAHLLAADSLAAVQALCEAGHPLQLVVVAEKGVDLGALTLLDRNRPQGAPRMLYRTTETAQGRSSDLFRSRVLNLACRWLAELWAPAQQAP